jgi:hypothetical protein
MYHERTHSHAINVTGALLACVLWIPRRCTFVCKRLDKVQYTVCRFMNSVSRIISLYQY